MKLGIFDSGVGGEAVAAALQTTFPTATILTVNDQKNVPYGDKTAEQIVHFTEAIIQPLLQDNCDIIILACNTATAAAIEVLRDRYPQQKFIGIEPMVKPASLLTNTKIIAVCATPATLTSKRYHNLLDRYAAQLTVLEPDCSGWAYMIQNNQVNRQHIEKTIDELCDQGADIIILGCTHYHWIKGLITEIAAGRAQVLEPSEAISRRVTQLLKRS